MICPHQIYTEYICDGVFVLFFPPTPAPSREWQTGEGGVKRIRIGGLASGRNKNQPSLPTPDRPMRSARIIETSTAYVPNFP